MRLSGVPSHRLGAGAQEKAAHQLLGYGVSEEHRHTVLTHSEDTAYRIHEGAVSRRLLRGPREALKVWACT